MLRYYPDKRFSTPYRGLLLCFKGQMWCTGCFLHTQSATHKGGRFSIQKADKNRTTWFTHECLSLETPLYARQVKEYHRLPKVMRRFDIRFNLIRQGLFTVSGKYTFVMIVHLKTFGASAKSCVYRDEIPSLFF